MNLYTYIYDHTFMEENKKIIQETCKRYQFFKKIMQVHITKKNHKGDGW
jgi:hypothetical protein